MSEGFRVLPEGPEAVDQTGVGTGKVFALGKVFGVAPVDEGS